MHVLLATAELSPLVKVGGLGDAVAGLRSALLAAGVEVTTVLPDYSGWKLGGERLVKLDVPAWAGPASARFGTLPDGTPLTLVKVPGIARSHPYLDEDGQGWTDNPARFMAFAAAVASVAEVTDPDLVHANDWHVGPTLGFLPESMPTVFTIHNLAYQGRTDGTWLEVIPRRPEAFEWWGDTNPLSGAIALADKVVTVSPNYAREILTSEFGAGLDGPLEARAPDLVGITNGIDTDVWDPATDPLLPTHFHADDLHGRRELRSELLSRVGWRGADPVIGVVTRLTHQKGVDLAMATAPYLEGMGARLLVLGSGDRALADQVRSHVEQYPDRVHFWEGYDEASARLIFAGADLLAMPSRFEPCGLNQMQAMRYGSIPVATAVGGLVDTIVDADVDSVHGTGFLAKDVTVAGMVDAFHRSVRALRSPKRRATIMHNGMTTDWSWTVPAARYREIYEAAIS